MLWDYMIVCIGVAALFTIKSFDQNTEKTGRIFYLFFGSMFWMITAYGLLKVDFLFMGSTNLTTYTYIPSWEAWVFTTGFGGLAVTMLVVGIMRTLQMAKEPLDGGG
jgi:hypothetical protein